MRQLRWRFSCGLMLAFLWGVSRPADADEPVAANQRPILPVLEQVKHVAFDERQIQRLDVGDTPTSFRSEAGESNAVTWWLPSDVDEFVLPISAGVVVDAKDAELMDWLRQGSPWSLTPLPVFGLRFGDRTLVVIVPWPQYAELVVEKRIGVRFSFPKSRLNATTSELVAVWCGREPLEVAHAFREWRVTADDTGAVPRPRPLAEKATQLPNVSRLFGAPDFYLWGPALFSRHDVDRGKWIAFAKTLRDAPADRLTGRVVAQFRDDQRTALRELAASDQRTWRIPQSWLSFLARRRVAVCERSSQLADEPSAVLGVVHRLRCHGRVFRRFQSAALRQPR